MIQDLAIIIVNRDLKEDTAECIKSLLSAGASLSDIVVIDNGSKDGSVSHLHSLYGHLLNQVEATENFGYPYGLNLGIRFFMERGRYWFVLMNNDVIVAPDFLKELENTIIKDKKAALIGPMILYFGKPETIWFMGARRIPGTLLFTNDHRNKPHDSEYPDIINVDFVHGCTMIVRRDVFTSIGLFDDSSPIYGDDVDFSWRARTAGFKLIAAPRVKLWHKVSSTMQHHKPKTRYLRIRNQIWFYRRYSKGFQVPFMIFFTIIRSIIMGCKDIIRKNFNLLIPLIIGWWDGWRGKESRNF